MVIILTLKDFDIFFFIIELENINCFKQYVARIDQRIPKIRE